MLSYFPCFIFLITLLLFNIWYVLLIYLVCSQNSSSNSNHRESRVLPHHTPSPWKCLTHGRCSIDICQINEPSIYSGCSVMVSPLGSVFPTCWGDKKGMAKFLCGHHLLLSLSGSHISHVQETTHLLWDGQDSHHYQEGSKSLNMSTGQSCESLRFFPQGAWRLLR